MLALAIALGAAAFGAGAVRRLGWPLTRFEAVALASAFALTAAPWALFLAAWGLGFAAGLPLAAATLGAAGYVLGRQRAVEPAAAPAPPPPSWLSWGALAVLFALLFHGHMLHAEAGGLFTGGATYGDLALHATLASRFAVDEVGFASPLVAGEPLTYPFLGDFLVACLVRGGWSMSTAFAVTGWLSALTGLALLDALARRMWGRRSAGIIAVWLIVLSGALIGLWHAATDLASHGLPSSLGAMPSYAHQADRGVVWSNIVADFFLPQRALLAAFPAAAAALVLMRGLADAPPPPPVRRRLALALALLIGALPFLHVHTFLLGAGLVVWLGAGLSVAARRPAWPWLAVAGGAAVLAAPQLAWQLGQSLGSGFGRWNLGWRAPDGELVTFWLRNWGLPLALAPVALVTAWRHERRAFAVALVTGAIAVFVAGNLYQFQPHDWDNMKFFVYAHIVLAVVLSGTLAGALAGGRLRRATAALAIVAMTGTGALTLAREADRHDQLASTADLALARELRRALPPDARVLTSDQHNHVVPMLTGRSIVMGYRGWLWTHGIDYRPLERDVAAMFAGRPEARRLLRRHGVTHVYIGPGERRDWGAALAWYRDRFPTVVRRDDVEVFDVRPRPARAALAAAGGPP